MHDPYVQSAFIALAEGALVFLVFRFFVPLLPGDGREAERRAEAEREASAKAAE